jgi:hypothetical protein
MAIKEEALDNFLKCFRIALNFILLYSKDHKSFRKSVIDLQIKTEELLGYLNPLEINFSSATLSIDGVVYSKMRLHRELAELFHQRKIQSLTIRSGITEEELVILFEKLAFSPKDIIKSGGLAAIFSGILKNPNFSVVDLDYSQLLRGDGEEVKDIWLFMLHNAVAREDLKKLNEFSDNFEVMLQKCKVRDLLENKEFSSDLHGFLEYLKKTDHEKFVRFSRTIMKFIIKDKSVSMDDESVNKLKAFLPALGLDDYAQVLWDEIVSDSNFDISSFQLFSKFLGEKDHEKIAESLSRNLLSREGRNVAGNVSRKVKELFSLPDSGSLISKFYLKAMLAVSENTIIEEGFVFDRKLLAGNYRYILLNLLSEEKDVKQLEFIVGKLSQEWDKIAEEKNVEYLKCLGKIIQKKNPDLNLELFRELSKKFYNFIEAFIWEEAIPAGFAAFFENMEASSFEAEVYFKNIFEEAKVNSRILEAFFRFFPNKLPDFYARLKDKCVDIDFAAKVVESLGETDSPLVLPVLEMIFSFSNDIIKIEIIRIMAATKRYNREFVFGVLKGSGDFMKKEALAVLSQPQDQQKAMDLLFLLPNPWGKNNVLLAQNLALVEELRYKQAVPYLEHLYRNTAFWNMGLKKKIKNVLWGLNV